MELRRLFTGHGANRADADAGLRPLVTLSNVAFGYDGRPAARALSGMFPRGAATAIVGPNGVGKSTLLKGLAGLLKPLEGRMIRHGAARTAYLPQASTVDWSFPIRLFDFVAFGLWRSRGRRLAGPDHVAVRRALEAVGLADQETRLIGALSGGQRQRALFARLLLRDADLILLDEPFSAIDAATTRDLLVVVDALSGMGKAVVAVLHDLDQVRAHFPRALLLAGSPVDWGESERVLRPEAMAMATARDRARVFAG